MKKTLKEMLLEQDLITQKDLDKLLQLQSERKQKNTTDEDSTLGQLLLDEGFINGKTLEILVQLSYQAKTNQTNTYFTEDKTSLNSDENASSAKFLLEKEPDENRRKRYKILKTLGQGGMGLVQLVKDNHLKREVALKTVKFQERRVRGGSAQQQMMLWRLQREALITGVLEHPNIIPIYDLQELGPNEFEFTMRKVEGKTLREILDEKKNMSYQKEKGQLLSIFLKVCDAIAYAHHKGVIHRDLKPDNIMIGEFGEVYVMDWGIAKQLKVKEPALQLDSYLNESPQDLPEEEELKENGIESKTKSNTKNFFSVLKITPEQFHTQGGLGTPGYMPPEQTVNAAKVTIQSDIFALGQILRECYLFISPIEEFRLNLKNEDLKIAHKHKGKVELYNTSKNKIPADIQAIIHKAKSKKQSDRYTTVAEMAEEIIRYQKNEWVHARSAGDLKAQFALFKKWMMRNRITVALIFALFVGFIGFSFYNKSQINQKYKYQLQEVFKQQTTIMNIPGKDISSLTKKVKALLKSMNWLNAALVLKPKDNKAEEKKLELGKELLSLCYQTQNFPIASFIATDLTQLSNLKNLEKRALLSEVKKQQQKKAIQEGIRLTEIEHKFLRRDIAEAEIEDIIYEISQFSEEATFQCLIEIINKAQQYYQKSKINPQQELFYYSVVEGIGRLGNQNAISSLYKALKQIKSQYRPKKNSPIIRIEDWMIVLTQALANLKAYETDENISVFILELRNRFLEQDGYYWNKTKIAYRKLAPGIVLFYSRILQKNPKNATAYVLRAGAKTDLKEYQSALADLTQAIKINPKFMKAYYDRGKIKFSLKEYQKAISDYNKAIECGPQHAEIYDSRATVKGLLKDYKGALGDFNKAIKLNPNLGRIYGNRGTLKYGLKDFQGAIADYNQAIKLNPQSTTAYYNRGNAKSDIKDIQGAIADYNQAIKLNPRYVEAYINRGYDKLEQGDFEGSLEDLSNAIKINPQHEKAYASRGQVKYDLKDYQEAISDFNEALKLNPNNAETYTNRGNAKLKLKEYQEAIFDYTKAIELNPQLANAYQNRGQAQIYFKKYKEALKDFNKAILLNPKYADAYNQRGFIKFQFKNLQGAIEDFSQTIKLDPQNLQAYTNRAYLNMDLKNYRKALLDLDKAIFLHSEDVNLYANRASIKQALRDYKGALKDYNKALFFNPEEPIFFNNRGNVKFALKDYREAVKDFDRAIKLLPKNPLSYFNRGRAKVELKEYQKAISDFEKTIQIDPKYPGAYHGLGKIYQRLGENQKAISYYKQSLQMVARPHPEDVREYLEFLFKEASLNYRKKEFKKSLHYLKEYQQFAPKTDPKLKQIGKMIQKLENS